GSHRRRSQENESGLVQFTADEVYLQAQSDSPGLFAGTIQGDGLSIGIQDVCNPRAPAWTRSRFHQGGPSLAISETTVPVVKRARPLDGGLLRQSRKAQTRAGAPAAFIRPYFFIFL